MRVGRQPQRYDGRVGSVPVGDTATGIPPAVVTGFTSDGTVVPAF